jgi:hypothetical protein
LIVTGTTYARRPRARAARTAAAISPSRSSRSSVPSRRRVPPGKIVSGAPRAASAPTYAGHHREVAPIGAGAIEPHRALRAHRRRHQRVAVQVLAGQVQRRRQARALERHAQHDRVEVGAVGRREHQRGVADRRHRRGAADLEAIVERGRRGLRPVDRRREHRAQRDPQQPGRAAVGPAAEAERERGEVAVELRGVDGGAVRRAGPDPRAHLGGDRGVVGAQRVEAGPAHAPPRARAARARISSRPPAISRYGTANTTCTYSVRPRKHSTYATAWPSSTSGPKNGTAIASAKPAPPGVGAR